VLKLKDYTMSLEVVCGPMFSGKSSYIYSIVKRYSAIGVKVLVIKPSSDTRYSELPEVVTHDGVRFQCFHAGAHLMDVPHNVTKGVRVVVVEEAQFFEDLLVFVRSLVENLGVNVVVVGLDGDAQRRPFGKVLDCIPLADKVTRLTALCTGCADGTPGLFSHRTVNVSDQVLVGGADMYTALCRSCYRKAIREHV